MAPHCYFPVMRGLRDSPRLPSQNKQTPCGVGSLCQLPRIFRLRELDRLQFNKVTVHLLFSNHYCFGWISTN